MARLVSLTENGPVTTTIPTWAYQATLEPTERQTVAPLETPERSGRSAPPPYRQARPTYTPRLKGRKLSEMAREEASRFLIEGAVPIPLGAPTLLYGPGGSGKTAFDNQLAVCLGSGTPFLGEPTERVRVAILDFENVEGEASRRLRATARALGVDPDCLDEWVRVECLGGASLLADGLEAEVASMVESFKPTLLIIDSLQGAFDADLTLPHEARAVFTVMKRLEFTRFDGQLGAYQTVGS